MPDTPKNYGHGIWDDGGDSGFRKPPCFRCGGHGVHVTPWRIFARPLANGLLAHTMPLGNFLLCHALGKQSHCISFHVRESLLLLGGRQVLSVVATGPVCTSRTHRKDTPRARGDG